MTERDRSEMLRIQGEKTELSEKARAISVLFAK